MTWRLLTIVALLLWCIPLPTEAACTGSSPTWTATADQASIQQCLTNVGTSGNHNDTISVGSGIATITTALEGPSNKAVKLVGAGIGQTLLVRSPSLTNEQYMIRLYDVPGGVMEMSGFTCDSASLGGLGNSAVCLEIYHAPGVAQTTSSYRVHHNFFANILRFGIRIWGNGQIMSGLIDNNEFYCFGGGSCQAIRGENCGTQDSTENDVMDTLPTFGGAQQNYIEDNIIGAVDDQDGPYDNYGCGRGTFRFNAVTNMGGWGHHGTEVRRGTQQWEYYHNTHGGDTDTWFVFRTGTGYFFNNTVGSLGSTRMATSYYRASATWSPQTWPWQFCNPDNPFNAGPPTSGGIAIDGRLGGTMGYESMPVGWPCAEQAGWWFNRLGGNPGGSYFRQPAYMWENRQGSNPTPPTPGNGVGTLISRAFQPGHQTWASADPYLIDDYDVFWQVAGYNGTAGMGVGTRAQMDAITPTLLYTAFWVTDEGDWNKRTAGADGRLYQWDGDSWELEYTPYEYPHPLQGFETATPPTAPSSLSATPDGALNTVAVTWSDDSDDETGFTLERCLASDCSDAVVIADIGVNVESYNDTENLAWSTTYYYRIKAVNLAGSSSYSNIDSATTVSAPDPDDEACSEEFEAGGDTTITCDVGINNDDTVLVALGWVGATTVSGCADTQTNIYTALTTAAANGTRKVQVFIARNATGGATVTITCTFSGSSTARGMSAVAVSTLGDNPQLDDSDDDTGTGTAPSSGVVTSSSTSTYILTVFATSAASGTPTVSAGFTMVHNDVSGFGAAVNASTAATDYTPIFTAESGDWVAQTVVVIPEAETDPLPDPLDEYFVDNSITCLDDPTQPGTEADPFCTPAYGVTRLAGGDTLSVKTGTYNGVFLLTSTVSGTSGDYTVIRCVSSPCTLVGSGVGSGRIRIGQNASGGDGVDYLRFEGFIITSMNHCIKVYNSTFIVVHGNICHTIGQEGIGVHYDSSFVTVSSNIVYDTGQYMDLNGECIYVGTGSGGPLDNTHNVLVTRNTVYNCEDEGIELKSGTYSVTVENNTIYDSGLDWAGACNAAFGFGIEVGERDLGAQSWSGNPSHVVRGNTLYSQPCNAIRLGTGGSVYNNVVYSVTAGQSAVRLTNDDSDSFTRYVYHNTLVTATADAITSSGSPTTDSQNNIGPVTSGTNLAYDAANHEAPASGNFKLVAGATDAINQGADVTATVATDKDGRARPYGSAPDIGAYEYGSHRPRRLRAK